MSMEFDTCLFGVIRPAPDSCDERGKWLKSELELKSETELKLEPKPKSKYDWKLKRVQDLELSDFAMYDDDIKPFAIKCARFTYENKAHIKERKEIRAARAKHKKRSRNLSPFDAITPPRKANICYGVIPLDITDDVRHDLIPLCKFALEKYNAENQGANYVFADIVKTTWKPGGWYYITFQAEQQNPPNCCPVTIFQAQVRDKRPEPSEVISCAIKT